MKEILIIITDHYPFGRGEPFLETEIQYLASNFKKIHIISRNGSKFYRETPSNVNSFYLKKFSFWTIFYSIKFLLSKNSYLELKKVKSKIDIIDIFKHIYRSSELIRILKQYCTFLSGKENITLYSYWLFYGALAVARIKNNYPGIKAISRAHGYDLYLENRKNNYIPFRKYLIKNLDQIYFISEHGRNFFINQYGHCKAQYHVSYLGSKKIIQENNCKNDQFHIVTCSVINENKRVHLIAEALSKIKKYKILWTHIGTGPLAENVKNKSENLLINKKNITYSFLGYLENRKVIEFLQANNVNCLINTSISEGLPFTIIEAFSVGIPVIAPAIGGISEIVDKDSGILIKKNFTIKDLVNAINSLITNPYKTKLLGLKAYEKWVAKFNSKNSYNNFAHLLKSRSKNILYVFYGNLVEGDGPTTHVLGVVKAWIDHGHHVDLFVFNNFSTFSHRQLKIITITKNFNPFKRYSDFKKQITKYLRKKNYLFIYARMHFYLYFITDLCLPSVFEANGIIELESQFIKEKYPLLANFERKFFLPLLFNSLRKANSIIVITSLMEKYFIENYHIDEKRIYVSGNGTSADNKFIKQNITKDNSIIFVGNLRKWQGIDKVVEEIIKRQRKDLKLKIIGAGELFIKLKKLIKSNNFRNIKLLGQMSYNQAFYEMKKSKIALIPRLPDKVNIKTGIYPLKLSQYWLAGLPILAADIPDLDIVEKIESGLNFHAGNYDDFFKKLDYLFSLDSDKLIEMGKKGEKYVLENKTWDIIGENILNFIMNV